MNERPPPPINFHPCGLVPWPTKGFVDDQWHRRMYIEKLDTFPRQIVKKVRQFGVNMGLWIADTLL